MPSVFSLQCLSVCIRGFLVRKCNVSCVHFQVLATMTMRMFQDIHTIEGFFVQDRKNSFDQKFD